SYAQNSLLIISTHLIQDIEAVLDEVIFIKSGEVYLHRNCDELREEENKTIDQLFREVYKW
ncbi:MAG TPA: ABC transporter ATP-binding protein, partial [Erysipelothrix sp.]|nr:ABC transporter ATP-binding protein [Erysipelothrix sp.]